MDKGGDSGAGFANVVRLTGFIPRNLTFDIIDSTHAPMPQLLVRDIEAAVIRKLRNRAAAEGVSVEEAHRRLLRSALVGNQPGPKQNFLEYLRSVPQGEDTEFPRATDLPRRVVL